MSFFAELKRRNVVRVGLAYAVIGWVLAQIGEFAFENFGAPDWVLKTFVVVLLLGMPLALFFAWAFELTPEGLKREKEVDRSQSITHATGRKLDFIIIAALGIAVAYFVWERATRDSTVSETSHQVMEETPEPDADVSAQRSIAVLPFVNMSDDTQQEYFADGLTEEILNSLAKTPDLLVASRTSSFTYKSSDKGLPEIAAELGVDHVLEGSVRRGGDTLRITAQLIRASDGFHVWSDTFDRTMDDVIAVQEEIAVHIAKVLETTLDPEALEEMLSAGTRSVSAYEAYLTGMGQDAAARETGDKYIVLEALESFQKAVELDPEFAQAHAELAYFWWEQGFENQIFAGITGLSKSEIVANREHAAESAIRFAKDETERVGYRTVLAAQEHNYRLALDLATEFAELRPNEGAEVYRANLLMMFGNHEEVASLFKYRFNDFPLTRGAANNMAIHLRTDKELMRAVGNEAARKFGHDSTLMYQVHRLLLWAGDIDGAARVMPRVANSDLGEENRLLVELRQSCMEGRTDDAQKAFTRISELAGNDVGITWLALEIMGEQDAAAALLDEYDEQEDFDTLDGFLIYPNFDPNRYPNFMRLLAGQRFEERVPLQLPYRCNR